MLKIIERFPDYVIDEYGNIYGRRGQITWAYSSNDYPMVSLYHNQKSTYKSLSIKYSVHVSTIRGVIRRDNWNYEEDPNA